MRMRLIGICALASLGYGAEFGVTHRHLRRDEPGKLTVESDGVRYIEAKPDKNKPHDFRWGWNDIQKLVLAADRIELTTYKDVKWLGDRDRAFVFYGRKLEPAYGVFRERLPRRFVPEIAVEGFEVMAAIPAKRLEGRGGSEGTLKIGRDIVVFQAEGGNGSHTWNLDEVENISSSDPLELTIASLGTDYRLQLKRPLPEGVYNQLWRKLNVRRTH